MAGACASLRNSLASDRDWQQLAPQSRQMRIIDSDIVKHDVTYGP